MGGAFSSGGASPTVTPLLPARSCESRRCSSRAHDPPATFGQLLPNPAVPSTPPNGPRCAGWVVRFRRRVPRSPCRDTCWSNDLLFCHRCGTRARTCWFLPVRPVHPVWAALDRRVRSTGQFLSWVGANPCFSPPLLAFLVLFRSFRSSDALRRPGASCARRVRSSHLFFFLFHS